MIFAIATTTLNKEVKCKLKTGQYSREEARFIYIEYLKLKKQRESGIKVAGISTSVIWGYCMFCLYKVRTLNHFHFQYIFYY